MFSSYFDLRLLRTCVRTYMRTHIVLCQDVCRRACALVSTKHGAPEQPGLDQVNGDDMTPLMAAVSAGNDELALELVRTLVFYRRQTRTSPTLHDLDLVP